MAAKFRYTVDRLGADVSGDQTTVIGRVTGDFPGSPVDLQYRFRLESASIARLEITAVSFDLEVTRVAERS